MHPTVGNDPLLEYCKRKDVPFLIARLVRHFLCYIFHDITFAKNHFEGYINPVMPDPYSPKNNLDPVRQVENMFFELQRNLTLEAKNIIWSCLETAKEYYPKTVYKEDWTRMLYALQDVINDFENQMSKQAELKLLALQKNLADLKKKEIKN
jgi:hypothetical protein